MNRLEITQEIYDKQQILINNLIIQGHQICPHYGIPGGLSFSVWLQGSDSSEAPMFNSNLELLKNIEYTEIIDEARAALKEFLEGEV